MTLPADTVRLINACPGPALAAADGVVRAVNAAALRLLGVEDELDALGRPLAEVLPPAGHTPYFDFSLAPTPERARTVFTAELAAADGAALAVELTLAPLTGPPDAVAVFLRPLDGREGRAARLEHDLSLLDAVFESIPVAAMVVGADGHLLRTNTKVTELTGYDRAEVASPQRWFESIYPDPAYRAQALAVWAEDRQRRCARRDFVVTCKNGEEKEVAFTGEFLDDGRYLITMQDVTDRKRFEGELLTAREHLQAARDELERRVDERTRQLRELSKRVLSAQEEERRHVSRELHDSVAQNLNAIKLFLQEERRALSERYPDFDPAVLSRLTDATQQAIDELRDIIHNMRPAILDELGIREALTDLLKRTRRFQPGLSLSLATDLDEARLDSETRLVLYRVTQECLHNIVRHSGAGQARVALTMRGEEAVLRVCDDGNGFAGEELPATEGLGIAGMRERLGLVGGRIAIQPGPDKGVCVEATVPLAPRPGRDG